MKQGKEEKIYSSGLENHFVVVKRMKMTWDKMCHHEILKWHGIKVLLGKTSWNNFSQQVLISIYIFYSCIYIWVFISCCLLYIFYFWTFYSLKDKLFPLTVELPKSRWELRVEENVKMIIWLFSHYCTLTACNIYSTSEWCPPFFSVLFMYIVFIKMSGWVSEF